MAADRIHMPEAIRRAVRQRCGFGCVICGHPLYHVDHLIEYSVVEEHDPENLTLLCTNHHAEKTNGLLSLEQVRASNQVPYNRQRNASPPYLLNYEGSSAKVAIGGVVAVRTKLYDEETFIALMIDDRPLVFFRRQDNALLLSAQIFDRYNRITLVIADNELVYGTDNWDVRLEGNRLTLWQAERQPFLTIRFDVPNTITFLDSRIMCNGAVIDVREGEAYLGTPQSTTQVQNMHVVDSDIALAVGEIPEGLRGGFRLAGVDRYSEFPRRRRTS